MLFYSDKKKRTVKIAKIKYLKKQSYSMLYACVSPCVVEIDLHGYGSKGGARAEKEEIPLPIILWWTDFLHEKASIKKCGDVRCFFTNDRHYKDHKGTKVGTFFVTGKFSAVQDDTGS